jgi:hypothetical protein
MNKEKKIKNHNLDFISQQKCNQKGERISSMNDREPHRLGGEDILRLAVYDYPYKDWQAKI